MLTTIFLNKLGFILTLLSQTVINIADRNLRAADQQISAAANLVKPLNQRPLKRLLKAADNLNQTSSNFE